MTSSEVKFQRKGAEKHCRICCGTNKIVRAWASASTYACIYESFCAALYTICYASGACILHAHVECVYCVYHLVLTFEQASSNRFPPANHLPGLWFIRSTNGVKASQRCPFRGTSTARDQYTAAAHCTILLLAQPSLFCGEFAFPTPPALPAQGPAPAPALASSSFAIGVMTRSKAASSLRWKVGTTTSARCVPLSSSSTLLAGAHVAFCVPF